MSKIYVIGDLHFGHPNILNFSPKRLGTKVASIEEHDALLIEHWNSIVYKKDVVWVLGDVATNKESLEKVRKLRGIKVLVRGNHDNLSTATYLQYFTQIYGILRKFSAWLSHCPIHPQELRGKLNIHGHVHDQTIPDDRYINVSVEQNQGYPQEIQKIIYERIKLIDKKKRFV